MRKFNKFIIEKRYDRKYKIFNYSFPAYRLNRLFIELDYAGANGFILFIFILMGFVIEQLLINICK